jgi:hypothetical protein
MRGHEPDIALRNRGVAAMRRDRASVSHDWRGPFDDKRRGNSAV